MALRYRTLLLIAVYASQAASFGMLPDMVPAVSSSAAAIAAVSSMHLVSPADILTSYTHSLAAHPISTKMATGGVLSVLGDAIAQSREPAEYDRRRAASFMVFDMTYRALQHTIFPLIVGTCRGQFFLAAAASIPLASVSADPFYCAAMERTLASQLGVVPFIYYPAFFALTGVVQGLSVEGSVDRAKEKFIPLMKRNLLFWIPVQFVQFGYVEEGLQIPFLCLCGLIWTIILSAMAGSTKAYSNNEIVILQEEDFVLPANVRLNSTTI